MLAVVLPILTISAIRSEMTVLPLDLPKNAARRFPVTVVE
jgi:hypothetical protein